MGRLSRGCLRCRQRRVRCDEGRPACNRCIGRNEICEGYRDDASIIFRDETDKVIEQSRAAQILSPQSSQHSSKSAARKRSKSVDASSTSQRSLSIWGPNAGVVLTHEETSGLKLSNPLPWLKDPAMGSQPVEDQVVDQFMDKYVIYPCNQTSSPGFLEHLPCMFKEVNIEGRYALRWAVQAAAFADISKEQADNRLARKALQCYSLALKALGESLALPGKAPDDYDLMTVVVLDIFESLYAPDEVQKGSHAQGMAEILRLRSTDLVYSPRGWSLFRVAQHRIQKQQLAFNMAQIAETPDWLNGLNDSEPFVRLEKNAHSINITCKRARELLDIINAGGLPASTVVDIIKELHSLDQESVTWRQTSQWSFIDLAVSERPDLEPAARNITDKIQLHSDVWMAYEWNYHRAGRVILLQQLLRCANAALETPHLDDVEELTLHGTITECISTIQWLAHEILATVPQSFGDVDHMGRPHDSKDGPPRCRAIGGYLLLWPIKIIKAETCGTTSGQKASGWRVFDKIRDYTGMKTALGDKSIV